MRQPQVVIIDSGICNLFNVKGTFESLQATVVISRSPEAIRNAERAVLPGVGAFGAGMQSLAQYDLVEPIRSFAKSGKPLLGICLGMQMLLSVSQELGVWDGLGLIPGRVRAFQKPTPSGPSFKIPQIGWNRIERPNGGSKDPWAETLLHGLDEKPFLYFVHSFIAIPEDPRHLLAYTEYGQDRFASVVKRDNISGCQFHPERSGATGLGILQNFLKEN